MTDKPVKVFCLAEYICEEMEDRGWTAVDVAIGMGGEFTRTKLIIDFILAITPTNETCLIDDVTFARIAKAFGTSPGFFKGLHKEWTETENPAARSQFECPEHLFGPASSCWSPP